MKYVLKNMSLRVRLNLLITALLLLFMVAVGYVIISGTKASIQEGVESATHVTTQLLDTVIISSVQNPDWGYTHNVLRQFLLSLGHVRSNQIRLYSLNGVLLYQSPPSKFRVDENPPQWFIDILDPHEESVTRLVRFAKLEIIPDSLGAIREAWSKVSRLFWLGLTFFILLNVMVYWMLGHWLRPLQPMLKAINQMEQGDLSARLPRFNLPEFERIGHSLNRMAESLTAERQLEENRQLTHVIQKHIEDERRSLARELHDELGQYVTAIKTFAVGIANKTKASETNPGMPDIAAHAQVIVSAANQIYDGMHNIVRQLRPGALDNLGLAETLKDAVSTYQTQNPSVKINLRLKGNLQDLGETVSINLYRIVQESLNNALKYAQASIIDIDLTETAAGELLLSIQDNGIGMDIDAVDQSKHFGLIGMRERVQALHGSFNLESAPDRGTAIHINIPNNITQ
ncbi:signal transduction histidine-protein kinase/phosphatase DegS [mine drainage metagenome]|uniref:histidine kinase n=1 Tax=mine drainage metagenome TaxID=410659 RepID=A0A1J5T7W1_9ZZZZ